MDIGFLGLGRMGQAMVRSLLRGGHQVIVWNRTRDKAEPLREAGARVADSIVDACQGDAVITMLANDEAVGDVVCTPHGVLDGLPPVRGIHVSMSTISPALVKNLAERHAERNQKFLSAPVLGRPAAAEQGKLFILAAGDTDSIEVMRPAFDAMGQRTFLIGAVPEQANVIKVCCNALIATIIEVIGETLALVKKAGIEPKVYIDVLLATVLGTPLYQPYGEHILKHQFEPGFTLPLALKDIELARGLGVPLPVIDVIRDHMLEAIAAGDGGLDWAALALVPQREAGLVH